MAMGIIQYAIGVVTGMLVLEMFNWHADIQTILIVILVSLVALLVSMYSYNIGGYIPRVRRRVRKY